MRRLGRAPIYDSAVDRLLLILPSASYRAPDFLSAARELGVAVTVASDPQFTVPSPLVLPPPIGAGLVAIVYAHEVRALISPFALGVPQPVQRS